MKTVTKKRRASKPMSLNSRIRVLKKENPFREGTGTHKRVQSVLACGNKTIEDAIKKGARRSTVRWMRDHKMISVAA